MNKLKYISFFTALIVVGACVESEDLVTEDAKDGGAILTATGSSGKLLGVPNSTTGEISFTDFELSLRIAVEYGGYNVSSYEIVKTYNGKNEVSVATIQPNQFPYVLTLNSLDDYLSGTALTANELRIGDTFKFITKIKTADGRTVQSNSGQYTVTVNCSSNLAGSYSLAGTWDRAETGNSDVPYGPVAETITEIEPGVYKTTLTGHYTNPSASLGLPICEMIFNDVCGELTIPKQGLCDFYSNEVVGTGYVDPATGNLYFDYTIDFAAGKRIYTAVYTKN
jgi:hypothetical protein